jgi:hypothetical protein
MTTTPKSAPAWLAWLPVITTLLLIAGFLWAGGGKMDELANHERRLTALETKRDTDADKLNVIDVRTARIEAKLEVLVPTNAEQRVAPR